MKIYFNGQWMDEAYVSATDRAFMYGEGVYESLRTYNKKLFAPHQHYERLKRSLEILALPVELSFSRFEKIIYDGLKDVEKDCTIRVMVSSGDEDEPDNPNLIVYIMELQAPNEDLYTYGVNVGISHLRAIPSVSVPSILKTSSHAYLRIARREKKEFYEVIFLSYEGFVAEGSMSNIFLIEDDTIVTPSIETGILDGVTRNVVIKLARSFGMPVEERFINVDELFNCSEIFLTRTSAEIIPVRKIESRVLFENEPNGLTTLLAENFKSYILNEPSFW